MYLGHARKRSTADCRSRAARCDLRAVRVLPRVQRHARGAAQRRADGEVRQAGAAVAQVLVDRGHVVGVRGVEQVILVVCGGRVWVWVWRVGVGARHVRGWATWAKRLAAPALAEHHPGRLAPRLHAGLGAQL